MVTYKMFRAGRRACLSSANSEDWHTVWQQVDRLGADAVRLFWIKAHVTAEYIAANQLPTIDVVGNFCADALADRAAEQASVHVSDVARFKRWATKAKLVQQRATMILLH
eukprot:7631335-Alexandrium_andersonii.AAC.1